MKRRPGYCHVSRDLQRKSTNGFLWRLTEECYEALPPTRFVSKAQPGPSAMKERPIRRWQFDSVSICLVLLLQLQLLLVLTSAASSASGGRHYGRGGLHPETLELKPPPNSQKKGQTGHSSHRNSMNRNDKLFPFNLFLERQESKRLLGKWIRGPGEAHDNGC